MNLLKAAIAALALCVSTLSYAASMVVGENQAQKTAIISIIGPIDNDDPVKFMKLVLKELRLGYKIDRVQLMSQGGKVAAALNIAEQIRRLNTRTHVMGHCESACFFMWVAGIEKSGTKVGVHSMYLSGTVVQNADLEQQSLFTSQKKAREYLQQMNVPNAIVDKIWGTPSYGIYYLTTEELATIPSRSPSSVEMDQGKETYLKTYGP